MLAGTATRLERMSAGDDGRMLIRDIVLVAVDSVRQQRVSPLEVRQWLWSTGNGCLVGCDMGLRRPDLRTAGLL